MAATDEISSSDSISISSYDTALCIIPPLAQCGDINRLRELYDKAYGKWPPHINLIYPFVALESLTRAQQRIQRLVDEKLDTSTPITALIDQAGLFKQRNNSTIYVCERQTKGSPLEAIRKLALQALGQSYSTSKLHLTIGQSEDNTESSREFLLAKARLLPVLQINVGAIAILIRERTTGTNAEHRMRLWGVVNVAPSVVVWKPQTPEYWIRQAPLSLELEENEDSDSTVFNRELLSGPTFYYDSEQDMWLACTGIEDNDVEATKISIASYNVLIDSEYPPARDRDPLLVRSILSDSAAADIMVLQEVSDDFLSYLLGDSEIQRRYMFASHGPPDQSGVGPLPSLRNIVILSSFAFSWKLVPFHRRHKSALVAHFKGVTKSSASGLEDLVVAGVHLTCGLTDGSVAAKKTQLNNLTSYLGRHHSTDPCVVAGDFNITTSTYTIDTALKNKSISNQTAVALSSIESAISNVGLLDAWSVARVEGTDHTIAGQLEDLFEGEEGATFGPRNNALAAATSGTSNNRAQRYDRILVRPEDTIRISHFNHFGTPEDVDGVQIVASDHAGIRTTLQVLSNSSEGTSLNDDVLKSHVVEHKRATAAMSDLSDLKSMLDAYHMFPTDVDSRKREEALAILKQTILGASDHDESTLSDIPMVMVSVGSYALGVWTSESDIDCLCIGAISSKTFFKLARQRLLKAEGQGVRILRRVEANTGTMLELSVNGVAMDLQYCPAARVVARWSEFRNIPATDPIFNLSVLSLRKLKPYRDLLYIQRTLPSLPAFRLAYRGIKLWAVQRGVYASRFGYLSGIHIVLMLTWVCKRFAHDTGSVSAADLLTSFFFYYARFDWANDIIFDAFFHKKTPRYHRSAREPMVILGYHTPNSNVAHTSHVPGVRTLVKEFRAANDQLSETGMTWERFFGSGDVLPVTPGLKTGARDFLAGYKSFVKVDIQFWGRTLAKGKGIVGWVESRCLLLVVDLNRAFPDLEIRIWPARFTDSDPSDPNESKDYHGCYLIGLSKTAESTTLTHKDDKQLTPESLDKTLDRFLTQLKTDEKNYDPSTSWIGVSLAKSSDCKSLLLDDREWGDYTAEMEPDSDNDEDLDDDFGDLDTAPIKRTIAQRPKPTSAPLSSTKLRPASDVLNRLRWDPSLDPGEYIIGYEDRFLGARETSLEKWKTEQTDEEFIPQHRILYFKRKGGDDGKGEIVWERVSRTDKVFGSGAGAGGAESATK